MCTFTLPAELLERLRIEAEARGISQSALIALAVTAYLDGE